MLLFSWPELEHPVITCNCFVIAFQLLEQLCTVQPCIVIGRIECNYPVITCNRIGWPVNICKRERPLEMCRDILGPECNDMFKGIRGITVLSQLPMQLSLVIPGFNPCGVQVNYPLIRGQRFTVLSQLPMQLSLVIPGFNPCGVQVNYPVIRG
jgi:hypothetical protein